VKIGMCVTESLCFITWPLVIAAVVTNFGFKLG